MQQSPLHKNRFQTPKHSFIDARAFGCELSQSKVPIVGCKIFYSDTQTQLNPHVSYPFHKARVIDMLSALTPDAWKRTVLLVESPEAMKITSKTLAQAEISTNGVSYYLSEAGEIVRPRANESGLTYGIEFSRDLTLDAFDTLLGFSKEQQAFVFGLYYGDGGFVDLAMGSLRLLAIESENYSFRTKLGTNFSLRCD